MKYFIADLHFGEEPIIAYENRPFKNAEDMDAQLIANWNKTVTENDEVYLIGDIGNEGHIPQLNGVKYLVKGNHDTKSNEAYRQCGFAEVYDHPIILDGFWILSHEPLYVSENMPYANIFGHVHHSPIYQTYSTHHYCVSVERIGYQPICFGDIQKKVQGK